MARDRVYNKVEKIVAKHLYALECELVKEFDIATFDCTLNEVKYNKVFDKFTKMFADAIKEGATEHN
jgi:hypothetical protein